MKKALLLLAVIILVPALPACSPPMDITTPPLTPTAIASPSPSPLASAYKQPAEDTVIIANGEGYIVGGYSGGEWLSNAEAAAYCGGPMPFISDKDSKVIQSSGVNMENGGYRLDIAKIDSSYCLYFADPERFPEFGEDKYKLVKEAVQKRLDGHYGKGKAVAYVNMGYSVDIDSDGKSEMLFQATSFEGPFSGADWYDMAGIIEEDGSMHFIAEYYNTGTDEDCLAWLQDVIDIDGDGVCEFVAGSSDFETETVSIYKYDGKDFTKVLSTAMPEAGLDPPADYPSPTPPPDITYKQPGEDTVIIADTMGYIIGGYSGGKWLSPENAAAYCAKPTTFYEYTLGGRGEKTVSSGVSSEESSVSDIWYEGMDEGTLFNHGYLLDIGEAERSGFLIYAGQDRFQQISELTDTSSVLSAVQQRLDGHFGQGKVEAQINDAITADIDRDGENEIVFNSCNIPGVDSEDYEDDEDSGDFEDSGDYEESEDYEDDEDYEYEGDWYCLSGIIEEDGSLHLLGEDYSGTIDAAVGEVISGIIDIDGDGKCEIIAEVDGYEVWTILVDEYDPNTDGREFADVIFYQESA